LPEIFSLRLIATTIANPLELKFEQEVLRGALQTLHSDLVDMNKLTQKIQEDMEFQRRLIVKLKLGKMLGGNAQAIDEGLIFCYIVHHIEM
jgi:hypothetical protein